MRRDRIVLRRDSADHEGDHDDGQGDEREQDDRGRGRPRDVPGEPGDHGHRHRRDDRRRDDGPADGVRGAQKPDERDDQAEDADEQPRRAAEPLQPRRRGEDRVQLTQLVDGDLPPRRSRDRRDVVLPSPGRWDISVTVKTSEFDSTTAVARLQVS